MKYGYYILQSKTTINDFLAGFRVLHKLQETEVQANKLILEWLKMYTVSIEMRLNNEYLQKILMEFISS